MLKPIDKRHYRCVKSQAYSTTAVKSRINEYWQEHMLQIVSAGIALLWLLNQVWQYVQSRADREEAVGATCITSKAGSLEQERHRLHELLQTNERVKHVEQRMSAQRMRKFPVPQSA